MAGERKKDWKKEQGGKVGGGRGKWGKRGGGRGRGGY
jgi:hypothetical protein